VKIGLTGEIMKARIFSLSRYLDECLRKAEYFRDENGIVIARVPEASGFFAQGDCFEEARENHPSSHPPRQRHKRRPHPTPKNLRGLVRS